MDNETAYPTPSYRDCYGNPWDNEHDARLATALYTAFDTQPDSSNAEIVAQLAEQFPTEHRTELESFVENLRDGWRQETGKPDPALIRAIEAIHDAMPNASEEEIARELHAKFPEVLSANRDALLIAGLDSMINKAKGWKSQIIAIQTKDGPMEIEAETLGRLAFHESAGNREFTAITHVPTGLRVAAFPPQISREAVRYAVERLQSFDWDFERPAGCPFPEAVLAEIGSILKELRDGELRPKEARHARLESAEAAL